MTSYEKFKIELRAELLKAIGNESPKRYQRAQLLPSELNERNGGR